MVSFLKIFGKVGINIRKHRQYIDSTTNIFFVYNSAILNIFYIVKIYEKKFIRKCDTNLWQLVQMNYFECYLIKTRSCGYLFKA